MPDGRALEGDRAPLAPVRIRASLTSVEEPVSVFLKVSFLLSAIVRSQLVAYTRQGWVQYTPRPGRGSGDGLGEKF